MKRRNYARTAWTSQIFDQPVFEKVANWRNGKTAQYVMRYFAHEYDDIYLLKPKKARDTINAFDQPIVHKVINQLEGEYREYIPLKDLAEVVRESAFKEALNFGNSKRVRAIANNTTQCLKNERISMEWFKELYSPII